VKRLPDALARGFRRWLIWADMGQPGNNAQRGGSHLMPLNRLAGDLFYGTVTPAGLAERPAVAVAQYPGGCRRGHRHRAVGPLDRADFAAPGGQVVRFRPTAPSPRRAAHLVADPVAGTANGMDLRAGRSAVDQRRQAPERHAGGGRVYLAGAELGKGDWRSGRDPKPAGHRRQPSGAPDSDPGAGAGALPERAGVAVRYRPDPDELSTRTPDRHEPAGVGWARWPGGRFRRQTGAGQFDRRLADRHITAHSPG
nr:hypothetical protein [Tanacetum cinerariifolium]